MNQQAKGKLVRVMIVGSQGQLGRELVRTCPSEHTLLPLDLPDLDICDAAAVRLRVEAFQPDLMVNAAAYTDVERAEEEPERVWKANEGGARILAGLAAEQDIPVVYYSTDFIFDGRASVPYVESDAPGPLGVYAETKLAGERATQSAAERHFILRTAWLYGPGGNNFVEKMLRQAEMRDVVRVVADEAGSPTHTFDLAETTWRICRTENYGVYHVVNDGACSRFEMTQTLYKLAGLSTRVEPCSAADFPSKAKRPAYAPLSTEKLFQTFGIRMRSWESALEHYLARRKELL